MRAFLLFLIGCHAKKIQTLEDHVYLFLDKKDQLFYQGFIQSLVESIKKNKEEPLKNYLEEFFKYRRIVTHDFSSFFLEKEELISLSKSFLKHFKFIQPKSKFKDYLKATKYFYGTRLYYPYDLWKFAYFIYIKNGQSLSFKEEILFFFIESLEESSELRIKKSYETIYQKMIFSLKRLYDQSRIYIVDDYSLIKKTWTPFSLVNMDQNKSFKQERLDVYVDEFAKEFEKHGPVKKILYPKTKSFIKEFLQEKTFDLFIDRIFFLFKDYEEYYPVNFIFFLKEMTFNYLKSESSSF